MAVKAWVRLPSNWIRNGGLTALRWQNGGAGADNIAALLALAPIAHLADEETGIARATYDQICDATNLSRAKLANGLEILKQHGIVLPEPDGARSNYKLLNYSTDSGWAKFPGKSMYSNDRIAAFKDLRLRRPAELDAMKLFFFFVASRDRATNQANVGYDKIEEGTGVQRIKIKTAISLLASLSLVYIDHIPSRQNLHGVSNAYRIVGIEPTKHMGTTGRALLQSREGMPFPDVSVSN